MDKIKRESVREQIKNSILKKIFNGTYPPGSRLREKELAELFGTSQAPVREALRELEGLQYVITSPYKGTLVREVSNKELSVAYKIRGFIEQIAIESIFDSVEKQNWTELKKIANKLENAAKNKNIENFSQYNITFHEYIIKKSDNPIIESMWKMVLFPIQVSNIFELINIPLTKFSEEHFKILKALENEDNELAASLLFEHSNYIRKILDQK